MTIAAVYRPHRRDVLLIRDTGECFSIPEDHVRDLTTEMLLAVDLPAHAERLAAPTENAWSAR